VLRDTRNASRHPQADALRRLGGRGVELLAGIKGRQHPARAADRAAGGLAVPGDVEMAKLPKPLVRRDRASPLAAALGTR
jgi:hypothetical protein